MTSTSFGKSKVSNAAKQQSPYADIRNRNQVASSQVKRPVTKQSEVTPVTVKPIRPTPTRPDSSDQINSIPVLEQFDRGRLVVLVDGANLFYAASQLQVEINYLKLLHCLAQGGHLVHALFYTGVDPCNAKQHRFLHWMGCNGYRVVTRETMQLANGSKKANLDVEIAVDMMQLAQHCDTIVLVSGDGDFVYAVKSLIKQGVRVEVVGLRSMTSNCLIGAADCYVDLNAIKLEIQKLEA